MQGIGRRILRLTRFGLGAAVGLLFLGTGVALCRNQVDQNHFRCYIISSQTPQPAESITLEDQFNVEAPQSVLVGEPLMFCPPTEKTIGGEVVGPIEDEEEHYALYPAPGTAVPRTVLVTDQFGTNVPWQLTTPKYVMVPTAKTINNMTFDDRANMNHYWCYQATGPRVGVRATLDDQFSGPDTVRVTTPTLFCNPAAKVHNGVPFPIVDEETHLACYEIHGKQKTQQHTFTAENQFETDQWQTAAWEILCAPAQKALPAQ
jgi:hypothetical protein